MLLVSLSAAENDFLAQYPESTYVMLVTTNSLHLHSACATGDSSSLATRGDIESSVTPGGGGGELGETVTWGTASVLLSVLQDVIVI
jgi:hypothetical protein